MLSRVRNYFQGAKFARMSSGTYCIIRDLGLVKGGKGMRHHEVLVTFSPKALWRWTGFVGGDLLRAGKRRLHWLQGEPQRFGTTAPSSAVPESALPALVSREVADGGPHADSLHRLALRRLPRQ
jgi:hypothetical protein